MGAAPCGLAIRPLPTRTLKSLITDIEFVRRASEPPPRLAQAAGGARSFLIAVSILS